MKQGLDTVSDLFEALPLGKALWMSARGTSLKPLLRTGDALRVERCVEHALAEGDIAVLKAPDGTLFAHLVVRCQPLVTSTFLGSCDPPGARVLGRAIAVRSRGQLVPLPSFVRRPLWLMQRAASSAYRRPEVRRLLEAGRSAVSAHWTASSRRRLLGPIEVRLLGPDDLEAAVRFLGDQLPIAVELVARQLPVRWQRGPGFALGAGLASGRLCGFLFVDSYLEEGVSLEGHWVRFLDVAPFARRLGVAGQLLEVAQAEARRRGWGTLYADVEASNRASLTVLGRSGFRKVAALTTTLNRRRPDEAWVGLEWKVGG